MNKYILLTVIFAVIVGCKNSRNNQKLPVFSVLQDTLNLGTINIKDSIESSFTIYNLGQDTLRIVNSGTSCGCTVASISNALIAPTDSAYVNIVYTSENDQGVIYKSIILESNTQEKYHPLTITANVLID